MKPAKLPPLQTILDTITISTKTKEFEHEALKVLEKSREALYSLHNPAILLVPIIVKESHVTQNLVEFTESMHTVGHYKNAILWGAANIDRYGYSHEFIFQMFGNMFNRNITSYRTTQNLLRGFHKEIFYVPPHFNHVHGAMDELLLFLNTNTSFSPLIKILISMEHFLAIHPFSPDGNGRLFRALMVLYLIQQKILDLPILNISKFYIKKRKQYFECLYDIQKNKYSTQSWNTYLEFMLKGFISQANETLIIIEKVHKIEQRIFQKIQSNTLLLPNYSRIFQYIMQNSYVTPDSLSASFSCSIQEAKNILRQLEKEKVLTQYHFNNLQVWVNKELLLILENDVKMNTTP